MDSLFTTLLAAVCAALAVFVFSLLIQNILASALFAYQEKYVDRSSQALSEMFLFVDGRQLFVLSLCVTGLIVVLGLLFINLFFAILLSVVGFCTPSILVYLLKRRRLKKFNLQLVHSLTSISNALKAGLTMNQAMEHVAEDAESPLKDEFSLFNREVRLGVGFDQALENMAARVACDDLELVVTSTTVARQFGGNMAEMFETIAETIRERFRLEGRVQALTSQGKLQGWIVACMPFVLGLALNAMRPDLMQDMMGHWFGYAVLGLILLMEAVGIFLIWKIVSFEV